MQAGECKCALTTYNGTQAVTTSLPGSVCTVCVATNKGPYMCTETGNKKNEFGPLCMGADLGPECTGRNCVCNWGPSTEGSGWRNVTAV